MKTTLDQIRFDVKSQEFTMYLSLDHKGWQQIIPISHETAKTLIGAGKYEIEASADNVYYMFFSK